MADRRIKIAKDKAVLVDSLCAAEEPNAPFRLKVDVLAFAAALGARYNTRVPLVDATKEPIRHDVFARKSYDTLINLLAVYGTQDASVLADNDEMEDQRATIFEEYANAGLHIMMSKMKGRPSFLNALLLIVQAERDGADVHEGGLDMSEFVT